RKHWRITWSFWPELWLIIFVPPLTLCILIVYFVGHQVGVVFLIAVLIHIIANIGYFFLTIRPGLYYAYRLWRTPLQRKTQAEAEEHSDQDKDTAPLTLRTKVTPSPGRDRFVNPFFVEQPTDIPLDDESIVPSGVAVIAFPPGFTGARKKSLMTVDPETG